MARERKRTASGPSLTTLVPARPIATAYAFVPLADSFARSTSCRHDRGGLRVPGEVLQASHHDAVGVDEFGAGPAAYGIRRIQELFADDSCFEPRDGRPDAEVVTPSEGYVVLRV